MLARIPLVLAAHAGVSQQAQALSPALTHAASAVSISTQASEGTSSLALQQHADFGRTAQALPKRTQQTSQRSRELAGNGLYAEMKCTSAASFGFAAQVVLVADRAAPFDLHRSTLPGCVLSPREALQPPSYAQQVVFTPTGIFSLPSQPMLVQDGQSCGSYTADEVACPGQDGLQQGDGLMAIGIMRWRRLKMKKHKIRKRRKANRHKTNK